MRTRLGAVSARRSPEEPVDIGISLRHVNEDTWAEVRATMLHEMVHQWQVERGYPADHGPLFRRKAVEVGIEPRATRRLGQQRPKQ
jgi:hypothetical protein